MFQNHSFPFSKWMCIILWITTSFLMEGKWLFNCCWYHDNHIDRHVFTAVLFLWCPTNHDDRNAHLKMKLYLFFITLFSILLWLRMKMCLTESNYWQFFISLKCYCWVICDPGNSFVCKESNWYLIFSDTKKTVNQTILDIPVNKRQYKINYNWWQTPYKIY